MGDSEARVTELLNEAALSTEGPKRVKIVNELKELLLHRSPELLSKYFEDVLEFQNDTSPDVRKTAVALYEEACRKDEKFLKGVVPALQNILFNDDNVNVQKRAMQMASVLFKLCLKWISTATADFKWAATAWETICKLRDFIAKQIDSDNDGIRTSVVKFMETVILTQTYSNEYGSHNFGSGSSNEICLDIVPSNSAIVRPRKLEEEAKEIMNNLLKFHSSMHITSANLTATMQSLTNIAKLRSSFLKVVIRAMQALNRNLPPTLAHSQVGTVRKMMKMYMMSLLKVRSATDYLDDITTLLTDLGASYQEILKSHPNPEEIRAAARRKKEEARKRKGIDYSSSSATVLPGFTEIDQESLITMDPRRSKRPRSQYVPEMPKERSQPHFGEASGSRTVVNLEDSAESYISSRLRPEIVVGLIMDAMLRLPSQMPKSFADLYSPPSGPGSNKQIRMVSRFLGNQMIKSELYPYDKAAIDRKMREKAKAAAEAEAREREREREARLAREREREREAREREKERQREREAQAAAAAAAAAADAAQDEIADRADDRPPEQSLSSMFEMELGKDSGPEPPLDEVPVPIIRASSPTPDADSVLPSVPAPAAVPVSKPLPQPGAVTLAQKQKKLANERLSAKTRAMAPALLSKLKSGALGRISALTKDGGAAVAGKSEARREVMRQAQQDVMVGLASLMSVEETLDWVLAYFLEDPVVRIDQVISWLFREYGQIQNFSPVSAAVLRGPIPLDPSSKELRRYDFILAGILHAAMCHEEVPEKYDVIRRLYVESPRLTDQAIEMLSMMLSSESNPDFPIPKTRTDSESALRVSRICSTICDLVSYRVGAGGSSYLSCLKLLLDLTTHPSRTVRSDSIQAVLGLAFGENEQLAGVIGDYALVCLNYLILPRPPDVLVTRVKKFGGLQESKPGDASNSIQVVTVKSEPMDEDENVFENGMTEDVKISAVPWNEEYAKLCSGLAFAMLPKKNEYLFDLVKVFVESVADVKRMILRLMEEPVRKLDKDSPNIIALLDNFPKGGETVISRMIHILTEKSYPSAELVEKVRELYKTKVSDVRFLIPVLAGLHKEDVMKSLPKLIRLAPGVVQEVFNRLLGLTGVPENEPVKSPVTPVDLMVALHRIPASVCDVKTVIKATNTLFGMKEVYTMEVLSHVVQELLDLNEIPTLLMRTVIQAYALYPKLGSFIMKALLQLIRKEVWLHPKIWEGFIKCCQRGGAQSCQVLVQLPGDQLKDVLNHAPELKPLLQAHVENFSDTHKTFVPRPVMDVLYGGYSLPVGVEPPPPGSIESDSFHLHPSMLNMPPPSIISGKAHYDGYR